MSNYPNGKTPEQVVRDSIATYVEEFRVFNECQTTPRFPFDVKSELEEVSEALNESASDWDELDGLITDAVERLQDLRSRIHEWYCDNSINIEIDFETVSDAFEKYLMDDGSYYEDMFDYINHEFLDFGYHRYGEETNAIQCLTHFGGPAGGFWIEEDGSISYWTAWWSPATTEYLRGDDLAVATEFFSQAFECMQFTFDDENGRWSYQGEGFDGALAMLSHAKMAM